MEEEDFKSFTDANDAVEYLRGLGENIEPQKDTKYDNYSSRITGNYCLYCRVMGKMIFILPLGKNQSPCPYSFQ